jgi:uncharacterized protein YjbI with pentapeptide repeats
VGADLNSADLQLTNLQGADLQGANLKLADVQSADLQGTILTRANLESATFFAANLQGANLRGANLRGANLYKANLRETHLQKVDLRGVDLRDVDLKDTYLKEVRFRIFTESDSVVDAEELFESAKALYEQLGFSVETKNPWRRGSLWQDTVALIKGLANSSKVKERAGVAGNVLLGQQDRETTVALAKAAVELENAFKGKKGAIAIDMGLFIFLRKSSQDGDGDTYFKRLTIKERSLLDDDPTLLGDPERLFSEIKGMNKLQAKNAFVQLQDERDSAKAEAIDAPEAEEFT